MLAVESTAVAIGLLLVGLLLLGLWPPCWNLVERKGRLPAHTFIDYGLTYMVMGSLISITLGQVGPPHGDTPNFVGQLSNIDARLALIALLGGVLIVMGDVVLQYSVAFLGLAIGPPLFSAINVMCGATATYFIDGRRNSPVLLFPGVAAAVAAIALGGAAHLMKGHTSAQQQQQPAPRATTPAVVPAGAAIDASFSLPLPLAPDAFTVQVDDDGNDVPAEGSDVSGLTGAGRTPNDRSNHSSHSYYSNHDSGAAAHHAGGVQGLMELVELGQPGSDDTAAQHDASHGDRSRDGSHCPAKAAPGDARSNLSAGGLTPDSAPLPSAPLHVDEGGLRQRRQRRGGGGVTPEPVAVRSVQMADKSLYTGLMIVLPGALLNTLSYLAFQVAVNDKFGLLPNGQPLPSVYVINFFFCMGFGLSSVAINSYFLARPPMGTARSSFMGWLRDNPWRGFSIMSGVLAASGDTMQFIGGDAAGYAAAMLVSAFPVVGVALGMLHFNEFKHASRAARTLVLAEVAFYLSAVGLLAASANRGSR